MSRKNLSKSGQYQTETPQSVSADKSIHDSLQVYSIPKHLRLSLAISRKKHTISLAFPKKTKKTTHTHTKRGDTKSLPKEPVLVRPFLLLKNITHA